MDRVEGAPRARLNGRGARARARRGRNAWRGACGRGERDTSCGSEGREGGEGFPSSIGAGGAGRGGARGRATACSGGENG
jgi:hypothetical protein